MVHEILRMEHVSVSGEDYSDLDDFNINIQEHQATGLVALNEIGLDALIQVLEKSVPVSAGRVYLCEQMVNSVQGSNLKPGRVVVIDYQSRLVRELPVVDNIALFVGKRGGLIFHRKQLVKQLVWAINEYGLDIKAEQSCNELSESQRCIVEILRAVFANARLILLHGLPEFLSEADLDSVYEFIEKIKSQAVAFLMIISRFDRTARLCDKVVLMRNGSDIKTFWRGEHTGLLQPVTYREEQKDICHDQEEKEAILTFQNVTSTILREFTFTQNVRECLCLCVNEDFQKDMENLLLGRRSPASGNIRIAGKQPDLAGEKSLCPEKLMIIRENALKTMIMYDLDYMDNLTFALGKKTGYFIRRKRIMDALYHEFEQKNGSELLNRNMFQLTKKEKYELIYARIELMKPSIVFIERPFVESDLDTRQFICEKILHLRASGITVLITSAGVQDGIPVADRIIVTDKGRISGQYEKKDYSAVIF